MAIVRKTDKRTGIVYVYDARSTWIPELKQPRSTTRLIGKIDPSTGEVVPTGKRGRPRKNPEKDLKAVSEADATPAKKARIDQELAEMKKRNLELELALQKERTENAHMKETIERIFGALEALKQVSTSAMTT